MTQLVIQPCARALRRFVVSLAVFVLLLGGLVLAYIWRFTHLSSQQARTATLVTGAAVVLVLFFIAVTVWARRRTTSYVLGETQLIARKGTLFMKRTERSYPYELMTTVRMNENAAAKRHGYTTIRIDMRRPRKALVLRYIPDAERYVVFIRDQIARNSLQS